MAEANADAVVVVDKLRPSQLNPAVTVSPILSGDKASNPTLFLQAPAH
jgi:hypothetical protein